MWIWWKNKLNAYVIVLMRISKHFFHFSTRRARLNVVWLSWTFVTIVDWLCRMFDKVSVIKFWCDSSFSILCWIISRCSFVFFCISKISSSLSIMIELCGISEVSGKKTDSSFVNLSSIRVSLECIFSSHWVKLFTLPI